MFYALQWQQVCLICDKDVGWSRNLDFATIPYLARAECAGNLYHFQFEVAANLVIASSAISTLPNKLNWVVFIYYCTK